MIGKGYASSRSTFSTAWRQCNESDFADINANENLRNIVMRLPEYLIERWRSTFADIREKGEVPTVRHISEFLRRRVKAEFDPYFGDLRGESRKAKDNESGKRNGIYAGMQLTPSGKELP